MLYRTVEQVHFLLAQMLLSAHGLRCVVKELKTKSILHSINFVSNWIWTWRNVAARHDDRRTCCELGSTVGHRQLRVVRGLG